MNLTKTLGLAFLGAALVFTSCKKDDDDTDEPGQQTCRVSKVVYFDAGTREDSATYTYTGDKITKATFGDGYYYTFEYSGDRVTKRSGFEKGTTTAEYYQQISYNSDGTISKIESYEPGTTSGFTVYERYEYTYASGKISKISYFVPDFSTTRVGEYTYTYTGNNVTGVSLTDFSQTPNTTSALTYTYDTNPNYYKKQNGQIHFIDLIFGDTDPTLFPLAISENNVTRITGTQGGIPVSYSLDDKQNLRNFNISGDLLAQYTYQCQ